VDGFGAEPSMRNRNVLGLAWRTLSALAGGLAGLLALRFVFRLTIANPANPVTGILYTISRPFLFPWERLWPIPEVPGLVVERATLVALGMYAIGGLILGLLGQRIATRAAGGAPAGRPEEETR
jgi:hypothetical protein